ncbi:hypothetical protein [Endozoicomonas sp. 4G]|uniref:hypothetical protein n=1 Tax=Endozoicomonas sp. 4G TaxID=2872754 RepID=UPI002079122B|nr:hypothetical protein [Endozoicomonas sp. 4G]
MQESVLESKNPALTCKSVSYSKSTLMQNLSAALPVLSTLREKDCKPFWNQRCTEIQPILWLPQKIALPDQGLNLSSGSLNYREDTSKFWSV